MNYQKTIQIFLFIFCTSLFCLATTAEAGGVKERMAARIPALTVLKNSGVIGENNKGFLEFRGNKTQTALINAENADRSKVYAFIAQKQGVSPSLVGKRRAAQIAGQGGKGQWFQNDNGNWYKK